jgi:hypothetical protein
LRPLLLGEHVCAAALVVHPSPELQSVLDVILRWTGVVLALCEAQQRLIVS